MKDTWEKITTVFMRMLTMYQELLGLSYQKQEVLVQNNVNELERIMKQEETLLFQVTKLDRIRKSMMKELALIYGLSDKEVTFSQICNVAEPEMVCNLKNIEQELRDVVLKMSEVTAVNKKLVDQGLLIVNYSLNLLAQSSVGPTYHPNEKASFASPNKALFDSKA